MNCQLMHSQVMIVVMQSQLGYVFSRLYHAPINNKHTFIMRPTMCCLKNAGVTTPLQSLLESMFNMLHESRLTELNASDQCTLNHIYDAVTIGLGNGINECMVSLSFSFKSFARHQGAMGQLILFHCTLLTSGPEVKDCKVRQWKHYSQHEVGIMGNIVWKYWLKSQ